MASTGAPCVRDLGTSIAPRRRATWPQAVLGFVDDFLRLGKSLDRVLRCLERVLRDEHLLRSVLAPERIVVDRELELGVDPGRAQNRLQFLRLGHVARHRHLHHPRHSCASSPVDTASFSPRLASAPPLSSCGPPRSAKRTSIVSKSLGTTVFGKIVRASRATSPPK